MARYDRAATELRLYIQTSSEPLYKRQLRLEEAIETLNRGITPDGVRAAFRSLVEDAVIEYTREYGRAFFSRASRDRVAAELAEIYLSGARRDGSVVHATR